MYPHFRKAVLLTVIIYSLLGKFMSYTARFLNQSEAVNDGEGAFGQNFFGKVRVIS